MGGLYPDGDDRGPGNGLMSAQDEFLAAVAAELPLPEDARREVLDELVAHLSDSVAELVAHGRDPEAAEREAVGRLGPPAGLAQALVRARRSRGQLLAAAGAGTWAAVRTGARAALLAWLLIVVATVVGSVVAHASADLLGLQASIGWTPGWNTVLTAGGLVVGALMAGAAAVQAVALRGWRTPAEVRWTVAAAGGLILAWFALVVLEQALNWASVVSLMLVPLAFIVGARSERLRLPSLRRRVVMLALALLVVVGASLALADRRGGAVSYAWDGETHGYQMIAPWWPDPASGDRMSFPSSEYGWSAPGVATVSVAADSSAVVAQFQDFRLEAWRAEPPGDGWQLLPGQSAPFATAPATAAGETVSGTLRFNQAPGVDWAEVVLTAVGPDGQRYLLFASGPAQTEFRGSVWTWFTALAGR